MEEKLYFQPTLIYITHNFQATFSKYDSKYICEYKVKQGRIGKEPLLKQTCKPSTATEC